LASAAATPALSDLVISRRVHVCVCMPVTLSVCVSATFDAKYLGNRAI